MDVDELCSHNDSLDRVMQHWQNTHSPMVYWTRQTVERILNHRTNKDDDLLQEVLNKEYIYGMPFMYGLPILEVPKVCQQMYQKDVVKLTLQISVPKTTQMNKYVTPTTGEMFGVIGKSRIEISSGNHAMCYFVRWHHWTLHGSQHCKLG